MLCRALSELRRNFVLRDQDQPIQWLILRTGDQLEAPFPFEAQLIHQSNPVPNELQTSRFLGLRQVYGLELPFGCWG